MEHALSDSDAGGSGAACAPDPHALPARPQGGASTAPVDASLTPTPASSAWRSRLVLTAACAAAAPHAKAGPPITADQLEKPTPELIRALRVEAGWTQLQAAQAVGCSHAIRWCEYERDGGSTLAAAKFELFLLKIGRHPLAVLRRRQGPGKTAGEGG